MTKTDSLSFQGILRKEFEKKLKNNAKYSLRAFARDLGVSVSIVSGVFNGKQGLSRANAYKIAKALEFNQEKLENFCSLVEIHNKRTTVTKTMAIERFEKKKSSGTIKTLTPEEFKAISDWHCLAILDLAKLPFFKSNLTWISRVLGISRESVEQAIEQLQLQDLIEVKDKQIKLKHMHIEVNSQVSSQAIKKFHLQMMAKASQALKNKPLDERDFYNLFLPMKRSRVPELVAYLRGVIQEINSEFYNPSGDCLYNFNQYLFELTEQEHL